LAFFLLYMFDLTRERTYGSTEVTCVSFYLSRAHDL